MRFVSLLVGAGVVLLGAGCNPSGPGDTVTAGPSANAGFECEQVLAMSAAEANDYLSGLGLEPAWRLERTTADGPVAEPVDAPPEGQITGVVMEGSQVFVFVTPPGDPILESESGLGCPAG